MKAHRIHNLINKSTHSLQSTHILIVGVGGIGCELLKVLSKCPIGSIHILDMDTIELSNLNRQFLFKQEHKGMSKALVARESVLKLNPDLNIHAHHLNIKELPISFFHQFNFLILALDNVDARSYVNKIGVRLDIPIIDAGTLAYLGNVSTIIPGQTKCYSCEPKNSTQKTYPVCTIRMRPDKPIHCVVWAKLLFEAMFGGQNEDNDLKDLGDLVSKGNSKEIAEKLFKKDIQDIKNAKSDTDNKLNDIFIKSINIIDQSLIDQNIDQKVISSYNSHDKISSLQKNISIFAESFDQLFALRKSHPIPFEKDDDLIIHFITAAANVRMHCFSIPLQSFNEIKNMAGNIVPAIASTNSIVSGIEVIEMIKFIQKKRDHMKSYFVQNQKDKIVSSRLQSPIKTCSICTLKARPVVIEANLQKYTLQDLVKLINEKLPHLQEFSINYGAKELFLSSQPRETMLAKTIYEIGESIEVDLSITDQDQSLRVCTIWCVHNSNVEGIKISNQDKFSVATNAGDKEEEKAEYESDGQIVMECGVEAEDDVEIIEVRKRPVQDGIEEISLADVIKKRVKKQ